MAHFTQIKEEIDLGDYSTAENVHPYILNSSLSEGKSASKNLNQTLKTSVNDKPSSKRDASLISSYSHALLNFVNLSKTEVNDGDIQEKPIVPTATKTSDIELTENNHSESDANSNMLDQAISKDHSGYCFKEFVKQMAMNKSSSNDKSYQLLRRLLGKPGRREAEALPQKPGRHEREALKQALRSKIVDKMEKDRISDGNKEFVIKQEVDKTNELRPKGVELVEERNEISDVHLSQAGASKTNKVVVTQEDVFKSESTSFIINIKTKRKRKNAAPCRVTGDEFVKKENENYVVIQSCTSDSAEPKTSAGVNFTGGLTVVKLKHDQHDQSLEDVSDENSCNKSIDSKWDSSVRVENVNGRRENCMVDGLKPINISMKIKKAFPCKVCGKIFSRHTGLLDHHIVHGGQGKHKCTLCVKSFTSSSNLANHMRVHTGEKPFKCKQCNKTFKQMGQLRNHENTHSGERNFKCEICGKRFFTMYCMTKHRKGHSGDKPFACSVCDRAFPLKWLLDQHFRTHTGVKPYKCDECDKSYPSPSALNVHKKLHAGKKPFHCNECGKDFIHNWALNMHAKCHTGEKPFKCDLCGQQFAENYYLTRHVKTHLGERRVKCKTCFRGFETREALTKHLKIHEKKRNFTCDSCGKGYFTKRKLTEHHRQHTGERPEKCDVCGKGFARSDTLRVHRQSHFKPAGEVREGSHGGFRVYGPQAKVQPITIKTLTDEMPEDKTRSHDIALSLLKLLGEKMKLGPEQIKEVASAMIKEVEEQNDQNVSISKDVPHISVDELVDRTTKQKEVKCSATEVDPNEEPIPIGRVVQNFKVKQCFYGDECSDDEGEPFSSLIKKENSSMEELNVNVKSVRNSESFRVQPHCDSDDRAVESDYHKYLCNEQTDRVNWRRAKNHSDKCDASSIDCKNVAGNIPLSFRIEPCEDTDSDLIDDSQDEDVSDAELSDQVNMESPSFEIDLAE